MINAAELNKQRHCFCQASSFGAKEFVVAQGRNNIGPSFSAFVILVAANPRNPSHHFQDSAVLISYYWLEALKST